MRRQCRHAAAVRNERERCAVIAETEPEPDGSMPQECYLVPLEDALRAAVRATRAAIASRIRAHRTGAQEHELSGLKELREQFLSMLDIQHEIGIAVHPAILDRVWRMAEILGVDTDRIPTERKLFIS